MRMPAAETVRTRHFTRAEYDRLIAQGFFDEDEPIELLDGLLVVKEPQGAWHVQTVSDVRRELQRAFGERYDVLVQAPVALDDTCEPEPDLVVVPRGLRDRFERLPSSPALVVEVSDSSFRRDRGQKAALYARGGVADYWIVSRAGPVLEVLREPARVSGRWKYRSVRRHRRGAIVTPLAAPRAKIRVSALLP